MNKINRNVERDAENLKKLKDAGWNVIIVWECELKPKNKEVTLDTLLKTIMSENG